MRIHRSKEVLLERMDVLIPMKAGKSAEVHLRALTTIDCPKEISSVAGRERIVKGAHRLDA